MDDAYLLTERLQNIFGSQRKTLILHKPQPCIISLRFLRSSWNLPVNQKRGSRVVEMTVTGFFDFFQRSGIDSNLTTLNINYSFDRHKAHPKKIIDRVLNLLTEIEIQGLIDLEQLQWHDVHIRQAAEDSPGVWRLGIAERTRGSTENEDAIASTTSRLQEL